MKYSNIWQHPETKQYHVMKGKQKFFQQGFDLEEQAEKHALVLSAHYYLDQANNVIKKLQHQDLSHEQFDLIHTGVYVSKHMVETMHSNQPDYDENDPCTWC